MDTAITTTDLQHKLNQVVTDRVNNAIDRHMLPSNQAIQRLINESSMAQDYLAPLGVDLQSEDRLPAIRFSSDNGLKMMFNKLEFNMHDNAVRQICEKLGIPTKYVRDLASSPEFWKYNLATRILNKHSEWTQRSRVLIRTVGDQVRGVLSDSYRRLDASMLLSTFLQTAQENKAVLYDAYMNDTNVWAEVILPQPINIHTKMNGTVIAYMGARFSTSDYGNGRLDMRGFILNGVCTNGMVRESVIKQVHLGAKLPEDASISNKTYMLDMQTTDSAIRDLTNGLFNKESIDRKVREIEYAANCEIDIQKVLMRLTNNAGGLQKQESAEVETLLMNNSADDGLQGRATLWKLAQAITAHARAVAPERRRELQELSGDMLSIEP